jgi:hypothetical protein
VSFVLFVSFLFCFSASDLDPSDLDPSDLDPIDLEPGRLGHLDPRELRRVDCG